MIPGQGVTALVDGKKILAGNEKLLSENGAELSCEKGHSIKFCVKADPVRQKAACKASGIWDFLLIA